MTKPMKTLAATLYHKLTKQVSQGHVSQGQVGQGIVEYVLLTSLIAISLISSLLLFKDTIFNILTSIPHLGGK